MLERMAAPFKSRDLFKQLAADKSGASATIIGLVIFALLGFAGLGIEVSNWYLERRAMQSATDSAALAAGHIMYEQQSTSSSLNSDMLAAAKQDATRNHYTHDGSEIVVNINHPYNGNQGEVEVTMTKTEDSLFSSFFTSGDTVIARRAVAQVASTGRFCILSLHPSCEQSLQINGTGDVTLTNCPIMDNSCANSNAAELSGTADVTTPSIAACGNYTPSSNFLSGLSMDPSINGGQPQQGVQPLPDPYSDVPAYANPGGCQNIPNVNCGGANAGNAGCTAANRLTLNPGCYNNMNFQNNRFYNLGSGNFYSNGNFQVGSTVDVQGTGVTIHLAANATADVQGTTNLSAPTTGTYADILFFQSRATTEAACGPSYANSFNGGANQHLSGSLYFPKQGVSVNGNSATLGSPQCLRIVSLYLRINGTSETTSDCTANGGTSADLKPPRLIQ